MEGVIKLIDLFMEGVVKGLSIAELRLQSDALKRYAVNEFERQNNIAIEYSNDKHRMNERIKYLEDLVEQLQNKGDR